MPKQKMYSCTAIDNYLEQLAEVGYECVNVDEGNLTSGDWICIPPTENKVYVIIKEVYVNCWQSAQTVQRCTKLSKANKKRLEEVEYYV